MEGLKLQNSNGSVVFEPEKSRQALLTELLSLTRRGPTEELRNKILENLVVARQLINQTDDAFASCAHDAARRHDLESLRVLIEVGQADVNAKTRDGLTLLHFAAKYKNRTNEAKLSTQNYPGPSPPSNENVVNSNVTSPVVNDKVVQYLCSMGAKMEETDENGMTALHYAVTRNNFPATKQLIIAGANLECVDNEKMTPLFLAIRLNHVDMVKYLLKCKANALFSDDNRCNVFHHACRHGDVNILQDIYNHIIENHGEGIVHYMLNAMNIKKEPPLHWAILRKAVDITKLCIDLGATTTFRNSKGETALHLAARSGVVRMALLLIEFGIDVNAVDSDGRTPIYTAIENNQNAMVSMLIRNEANLDHEDCQQITPLLLSAKLGRELSCSLLLSNDARVKVEDKLWKTPLMLAVEGKFHLVVELLFKTEDGLQLLEWEDMSEERPLHAAVRTGNIRITSLLLQHGANIMAKNAHEQTPLHVAAIHGRFSTIRKLLDQTPIVAYERDEDGNLALHLAAKHGYPQVMKTFLEQTMQVNERNGHGWTPLAFAAAHNHPECVKILLQEGAEVNSKEKSNMTPLFLACRGGHVDVVGILLEAGADPGIRVSRGHAHFALWNSLDIAIHGRKTNCVQAILECNAWQAALRNETYEDEGRINTPLQKLICHMPDAAELALSRCVVSNSFPKHSSEYAMTFNFEFVDDRTVPLKLPAGRSKWLKPLRKTVVEDPKAETVKLNTFRRITEQPVSANPLEAFEREHGFIYLLSRNKKRTHPVEKMVECGRVNLLNHQLVVALLAFKWTRLCFIYYSHLLIYAIFLTLFTTFMLQTVPPYLIRPSDTQNMRDVCHFLLRNGKVACHHHIGVSKYGLLTLSAANLIVEMVRLIRSHVKYLNLDNLLGLSIYSLAILTAVDTNWCMQKTGLREIWQWGCGTTGLLLAWLNLLLFIRKGPTFGIFVIMFVVVMLTFIKFFLVFSPFLLAFALSFHALLANQIAFSDVKYALIKTFTMVVGEIDANSLIFERVNNSELDKRLYYEGITYALFVGFIALMSIVMMNLLVGLAVDDIKGVQRKATFIRQKMKISLLFSAEALLARFGRYVRTPKQYVYRPNNSTCLLDWWFHKSYKQSTRTMLEVAELEIEEDKERKEVEYLIPSTRLDELQHQMLQVAKLTNKIIHRVNTFMTYFNPEAPVEISNSALDQVESLLNDTFEASGSQLSYSEAHLHKSHSSRPLLTDEDIDMEPVHFQ